MELNSHDWRLLVDLNGGRIRELSFKGVKVLGTYNRIDGKQGNTHLCIPSFDREGMGKWNLPFHGLVRNIPWTVKNSTKTSVVISCETQASEAYAAQLHIEQEFILEEEFMHRIHVTNREGDAVPMNIGYHYYWDTPQGWQGTRLNGKNIQNQIESNGFQDLMEQNHISFPHGEYSVSSQNFGSCVLWTSFKDEEKGKRKYNSEFCCIEPVVNWPGYFGTDASILQPGETFSASIGIKKVV